MTIREEIANTIAKKWFDNNNVENTTDEILKLFEKLIDKKMAKYPYYTEAFEELKEELKEK